MDEAFDFEITTDDYLLQAQVHEEVTESEQEVVRGKILPGAATVTLGSEKGT